MLNLSKSKVISIPVIISFLIFSSNYFMMARTNSSGNLIGFIYTEDGTSPAKGVVFKVRNINTGEVFKSTKTDDLGMFKMKKLEQGLYIAGVSTKEGDFNLPNLIGIKANETANISLTLKPVPSAAAAAGKAAGGSAAFFTSPLGILLIIVASAGLIWGLIELTEKEAEASPFKK